MAERSEQKMWWVYFIRTPQNALYCGITTDVDRRYKQHMDGKGAKALRGKSPLELVWRYQVGPVKGNALQLEYKLKQLSKMQKERLISGVHSIDNLLGSVPFKPSSSIY